MKYPIIFTLALFSICSSSVDAQSSWKSFKQHGYYIELPDYFLPVASQNPAVDVFVNSNNREILLRIENSSSDQLNFNSKYLTEIANTGVTSKVIKDSVYTVSYGDGNTINYHKSFLSNGQLHSLIVSYPNKEITQFDLVLQRIGRSFK